jgi:hypothetical protein
MHQSTATDLTASFLMTLPPGWVRFPARPEDRAELELLVESVVADAVADTAVPRDSQARWRHEVRRRLLATVLDAGEAGATAAVIPVTAVNGFVPPISIVESEVDDESEHDPADVIANLLAEAGQVATGLRDIDGAAAARTETTSERVQVGHDLPVITNRQVVYTIAVPDRPGRWLVLSCSVVQHPDADPRLTDALVGLFDALMTTVRWIARPDGVVSDLERRVAHLSGADA